MNKYKQAAISYHDKGYIPGHEWSNDPKFWAEVGKEGLKRMAKRKRKFNDQFESWRGDSDGTVGTD
jgi:hypothetical protein